MNHFYHNIPGWFDFEDIYLSQIERMNGEGWFVEIGAWMGKSTSFMAVEVLNSNKDIKFDVVDIWDDDYKKHDFIIRYGSLKKAFLRNVSKAMLGIHDIIDMSSEFASHLYEDNSLDFIFIDGSHKYENVVMDILSWFPKLKDDGVMAGHDYYRFHDNEEDYDDVQDAVHRIFGTENVHIIGSSWLIHKQDFIGKQLDGVERVLKRKRPARRPQR